MPEDIRVSMFEVVGGSLCVASSDGQKIYDRLAAALKADRHVVISFNKVTTLTAAFLNAAIGQLYGTFSEEIRSLNSLSIEGKRRGVSRSCTVEARRWQR